MVPFQFHSYMLWERGGSVTTEIRYDYCVAFIPGKWQVGKCATHCCSLLMNLLAYALHPTQNCNSLFTIYFRGIYPLRHNMQAEKKFVGLKPF